MGSFSTKNMCLCLTTRIVETIDLPFSTQVSRRYVDRQRDAGGKTEYPTRSVNDLVMTIVTRWVILTALSRATI